MLGFPGIPGSNGIPGVPGVQGPHGPHGREGVKGQIGDKGSQGMPGPRRDRGREGPRGIKGMKGEAGIAGMKGERGAVGNPGRKGDKGEKGESAKAGQASVVPQTNWKQCVWKSVSGTDNGKIKIIRINFIQVTLHTVARLTTICFICLILFQDCSFNKLQSNSALRVSFQGNMGSMEVVLSVTGGISSSMEANAVGQ